MGEITKGDSDLMLMMGTSSGTGGTMLAAVTEISHDLMQDAVETTAADCTDGWRTFAVGLKDAGTITGKGNYLPANASQKGSAGGLLYRFNNDSGDASAVQEYTIIWPDAAPTKIYGSGILTTHNVSASIGEKLTFDFTIKMSGVPTIA